MRWFTFFVTGTLALAAAPQRVSIGNRFLERNFEMADGRVRTVSVYNRLDQRLYPVDSEEFELSLVYEPLGYTPGGENPVRLTAADFAVRNFEKAGETLTFHLENQRFGLEVDMVFHLAAADFYLRKWLEIRSSGRNVVFLDRIGVEKYTIPGVRTEHGGFGQPVYAGNLFLGLEYPAGYNCCYYYSGEVTGPKPLRTESAVLGVARDGLTRSAFMDYIGRIRSGKVRPVTVFNTWYDMQGETLTEKNSLERMAALKSNLLEPFRIRLDSFVLDDGWDDRPNPWTIHPRKFGGDFSGLSRTLRSEGTALGLWFGPIGGYGEWQVRIEGGRRQGWEVTANGRNFCLAGRNYHEKFKQIVLEMVRRYRVNHFKFDGIPYGCNDPGHGHLPGVYSREAHVRAFIDILKSIRAADPEVFLNITTGNWLSPWWLPYTDVVFMGGLDYGFLNDVPAVSERDKAITYRDKILYDNFRLHACQFPHNSLMTIGIIKGLLGSEGGRDETLEAWAHNVIMNYSRGSMMTELYISPSMLKPEEWQALGSIMRWAHVNSDVLLGEARFIGGDPGRRQVYGYSHFKDGRGIVTLRNPSIERQVFELALDERGGEAYRARVIFPYTELLPGTFRYGDSLPLTLEGFEVKVLEFGPVLTGEPPAAAKTSEPAVEGLRMAGSSGSFTLTTRAAARLAILCESAGELRPALRGNGEALKFSTVSPGSSERGLGVGVGGWTFLVAPLAAGRHQIDFELAGAAKATAWLISDLAIGTPVIPAPTPKERLVTQLFSKEW